MIHSITNIAPDNVPELTYDGKLVVTTAQLAEFYGAGEGQLRKNYSRNKSRFEPGVHLYKIEGKELSDLRASLRHSQIPAKARSVTLYTRIGAARHAKMLETDRAWDVYEALEKNYFNQVEQPSLRGLHETKQICKTSVKDRAPLKQLVNTIVDARTRRGNPSDYSSAWREINGYLGLESIQDATHDQIELGITFARKVLEGELCSPQFSLPDSSQETVFDDDEMSD